MSKFAPVDLVELARTTAEKMQKISLQAYAPVTVQTCWRCGGIPYDDNGDKCFVCAGTGRLASDRGEV
jgi:hypothetical protein